MITREAALLKLDYFECVFNYKKIYIDGICSEQLLNEIYDSFEQHIKSLETQLANTEQLKCDGCEYDNEYKEIEMRCLPCKRRQRTDYYQLKDTQ